MNRIFETEYKEDLRNLEDIEILLDINHLKINDFNENMFINKYREYLLSIGIKTMEDFNNICAEKGSAVYRFIWDYRFNVSLNKIEPTWSLKECITRKEVIENLEYLYEGAQNPDEVLNNLEILFGDENLDECIKLSNKEDIKFLSCIPVNFIISFADCVIPEREDTYFIDNIVFYVDESIYTTATKYNKLREDAEEIKVIFSNNEILGVNPDDEGIDCIYVKGVLERVQ